MKTTPKKKLPQQLSLIDLSIISYLAQQGYCTHWQLSKLGFSKTTVQKLVDYGILKTNQHLGVTRYKVDDGFLSSQEQG